jgi:predicted membrane protein
MCSRKYWAEQVIIETWTDLQQLDDKKLAASVLTLAELAAVEYSQPAPELEVLPVQYHELIHEAMNIQQGISNVMHFATNEEKQTMLKAFVTYSIQTAVERVDIV